MRRRKNICRRIRVSPPRRHIVSYRYASDFAKKLKRYSFIEQSYVYVYEEQKIKDEEEQRIKEGNENE